MIDSFPNSFWMLYPWLWNTFISSFVEVVSKYSRYIVFSFPSPFFIIFPLVKIFKSFACNFLAYDFFYYKKLYRVLSLFLVSCLLYTFSQATLVTMILEEELDLHLFHEDNRKLFQVLAIVHDL